jgi:SAM-dependent methyltransferase
MTNLISGNYRGLSEEEIPEAAARCADAWKNPDLPRRQYTMAVESELNKFENGRSVPPYGALIRCWKQVPTDKWKRRLPQLLDVGASSAYYNQVLKLAGINVHYTACDYSRAFQELAARLYPAIPFDIAAADNLPYGDSSFDVILHSACIMHIYNWRKAVQEAKRVTGGYVILHRTPVSTVEPTKAFLKEGYGVEMFEWQFNENELLSVCAGLDLAPVYTTDVSWDEERHCGMRSYLLKKDEELFYHPV